MLNDISTVLVFLELGDGWGPAILETEAEFNFVREADKSINDTNSYWIGGSTNNCCLLEIPYSDYIPDDSGKSAHTNFLTAYPETV